MTSIENPAVFKAQGRGADFESTPGQFMIKEISERGSEPGNDRFLEPTHHLTARQAGRVLVFHGIMATIFSACINLALAEAMYGQTEDPINLFQFPNSLIADTAMTTVMQSIITWMIELVLVNHSLKHAQARPVGGFREPKNGFLRWYMFLNCSSRVPPKGIRSVGYWLSFIGGQILRALMVAAFTFAIAVGPCIGFLMLVGTPSGGDWTFTANLVPSLAEWKPQIYKTILGAVIAMVQTPVFALFWLIRCGWAVRNNEVSYGEK